MEQRKPPKLKLTLKKEVLRTVIDRQDELLNAVVGGVQVVGVEGTCVTSCCCGGPLNSSAGLAGELVGF